MQMNEIETFSDEQLAGQRLMVGFGGTTLNSNLRFFIDTIKVGGVILFARNLANPDQIKTLCRSIQDYAKTNGQPPLFIAIDQEGGQVARLKPPFTQFSGNPKMKGVTDAAHFSSVTADELTDVGINMDMAPVLDVVPSGMAGVMEKRVFGNDPAWVSLLGREVIAGLQERNIMAVAKHFPGIGRTTLDSHIEKPELDVALDELEQTDLVPFAAAVENDVAGVMLSHILYRKIDTRWPASLSVPIAKHLLRDRMKFEGLIVTDDLDMGAIVNHFDIDTAIERILLADIDIALICHQGPKIEAAFNRILETISRKGEAAQKGRESVERILRLKKRYLYVSPR